MAPRIPNRALRATLSVGIAALAAPASISPRRVMGLDIAPDTVVSILNLGGVYAMSGRDEAAEQLYLEALEAQPKDTLEGNRNTLMIMANLAVVYREQGREEEAGQHYLAGLEALLMNTE